jgi:very-short-patch-repair endonuclease
VKHSRLSALEEKLAWQIKQVGLPKPEREYRFHPPRLYRADFAWLEQKLLVECEGGIFRRGGGWHQSVGGYLDDLEKYNLATLYGWRVLRYSARDINSGLAVKEIERALQGVIDEPLQMVMQG